MSTSSQTCSSQRVLNRNTRLFLFLKLTLLTPLIHISLLSLGFQRTQRFLKERLTQEKKIQPTIIDNRSFSRALRRLDKRFQKYNPLAGSCLSRTLSLWWLLQKMGIHTVIKIGTRREDGQFKAHAWLEYGNFPLNSRPQSCIQYEPFDYDF